MTQSSDITKRGALAVGQRVRVTAKHMELFPRSLMRHGVLRNFCRGTIVRVCFEGLKYPREIDERFIEAA